MWISAFETAVYQACGISGVQTGNVIQKRLFVFLSDYHTKNKEMAAGSNKPKTGLGITDMKIIICHVHMAPFPQKEQTHLHPAFSPSSNISGLPEEHSISTFIVLMGG
jgi:hypothetical protein